MQALKRTSDSESADEIPRGTWGVAQTTLVENDTSATDTPSSAGPFFSAGSIVFVGVFFAGLEKVSSSA